MFAKMPINDLARDRNEYQKIVAKALLDLPEGIKTREVIDGHYLFFRVYFGSEITNFHIDKYGAFKYFDKDESIIKSVTTEDIIAEFVKARLGYIEE